MDLMKGNGVQILILHILDHAAANNGLLEAILVGLKAQHKLMSQIKSCY